MATQHAIRNPDGEKVEVTLRHSSAIRAFCTECMGWDGHPKDCTSTLCPLFPFRGKSLAYRGKQVSNQTPEQRQAAGDRLRAMHEANRAKATP